jgi:hypothetical protein
VKINGQVIENSPLTSADPLPPTPPSPTLPQRQFGFNDGFDDNVGQDRTPTGVRSPVARQAIDESSMGYVKIKAQRKKTARYFNGIIHF